MKTSEIVKRACKGNMKWVRTLTEERRKDEERKKGNN